MMRFIQICAPKICDLKTRVEFPTSVFATKSFQKVTLSPKRFYQHWFFSPKKHQRIFFGSQLFSSSPALRSQVEKPPFFSPAFLGGGNSNILGIFTPNLGEDSQFDECLWDGLKPPTSFCVFFFRRMLKLYMKRWVTLMMLLQHL